MGRSFRLGFVALTSLLLACSSKHSTGGNNEQPGSPTDGGGGLLGGGNGTDGGGFGSGGDAGFPASGECNASTQFVYVVSEENTLYSFAPDLLQFTPIGQLNCGSGGATPTSMGVDRSGTAWVLLSDGSVNKVNVKDASCTTTTYVPGQAGFAKFGMGFSTDGATATTETLFVSDHDGKGLAKIDLGTLKLTTVGAYSGDLMGQTSELTGTGDGRLFGFFTTSPARIAEIDKSTGMIKSENPLANTYAGTAWAFSFYAGDFYVYTADNSGSGLPKDGTGSDVTRYRPADGSVTIVKAKIGFTIVGAGVSTCVPTTGPK